MPSVEGHEQVLARLQALDAGTTKKILRPSLIEGCEVVLPMAQSLAPKKNFRLVANLKIRKGKQRKGSVNYKVGADIGDYQGPAFYTPFVLWGHRIVGHKPKKTDTGKKTRPNDFIRRAYEYTKIRALNAVIDGATQRIEKLTTGQSVPG